jgi:hypothetical protein
MLTDYLNRTGTYLQEGMVILLGDNYAPEKGSHQNPTKVKKLEDYPPLILTDALLKTNVAERYAAGRTITVSAITFFHQYCTASHIFLKL